MTSNAGKIFAFTSLNLNLTKEITEHRLCQKLKILLLKNFSSLNLVLCGSHHSLYQEITSQNLYFIENLVVQEKRWRIIAVIVVLEYYVTKISEQCVSHKEQLPLIIVITVMTTRRSDCGIRSKFRS